MEQRDAGGGQPLGIAGVAQGGEQFIAKGGGILVEDGRLTEGLDGADQPFVSERGIGFFFAVREAAIALPGRFTASLAAP